MEISDITGLSKPLEKLVDFIITTSNGIFKPYQMKRIAKAESEIERIKRLDNFKSVLAESLAEYVAQEVTNRESIQAKNITNIYKIAAQELNQIQEISDEPVDFEWSMMFNDYAQNVSDEDVQLIWAKILSGELNSPGKYSKRTLMILKHLEKSEAECFAQLCNYAIDYSYFFNHSNVLNQMFPHNLVMSLQDAGLLLQETKQLRIDKDEYIFNDVKLKILNFKDISMPPFNVTVLSKAGMEILDIVHQINTKHDDSYIEDFINTLSKWTTNKELKYSIVNIQ